MSLLLRMKAFSVSYTFRDKNPGYPKFFKAKQNNDDSLEISI